MMIYSRTYKTNRLRLLYDEAPAFTYWGDIQAMYLKVRIKANRSLHEKSSRKRLLFLSAL